MNCINNIFFELVQVAIDTRICLSHTPSADEWGELYKMAKKQSLVGVCFVGVQKLVEQRQELPEMLYFTWLGMAAKIQQRNEVVNRQCVELQKRLSADGFRSYIMKGQYVATLYGEHLAALRQSGDIDVYLEGGLDKVLAYARTFGEVKKVNELEMSVPVYEDPSTNSGQVTEVEFHYRPFIMRNPFKNAKLQKFFDDQSEACFTNRISLENKAESLEIMAPTIVFNLVHQMVHTYHHFITEGVGLRQLMDYYFVIQASNPEDINKCQKMVESLGLNRFASALMWVLMHVFGLKVEQALWAPCEKDGRLLLDEILMSGNFGHTDERAKDILTSRWKAFWFVNGKTFHFWRFNHWAWFWSPVWRVYHFCWRKSRGFK
ncbi:MAG: nucleotidyltransferase family protein [Prevotellaceae bacterium]|nr:nucleotidyltransferase family protein [Prevotellaceae bacterium]